MMLALGSSEASAQVANINYNLKSAVNAAAYPTAKPLLLTT